MTVGRCGSTALMQALRAFPDISTPGKAIDCVDDELLHPEHATRHASDYAGLTGQPVRSADDLLGAFFRHHSASAYAGFKSMPNRHRDFAAFVRTPEIRFIGLVRYDIPSTVASFLIAMAAGCWRRDGGAKRYRLAFDAKAHGPAVASNLRYVLDSLGAIDAMPNAIRLVYEELCRPDFRSAELDDYFERSVRLANPKPPLHAGSYILNWPEFRDFIQRGIAAHGHAPAS